jgi:hypothetical protein
MDNKKKSGISKRGMISIFFFININLRSVMVDSSFDEKRIVLHDLFGGEAVDTFFSNIFGIGSQRILAIFEREAIGRKIANIGHHPPSWRLT